MREVIYREDLYSRLHALSIQKEITAADIAAAFRSIPSADPPEIVRCKYCANRIEDPESGLRWCPMMNNPPEDNFFCGYGRRKKDE